MNNHATQSVFVDWLTINQFHPKGGFPILLDGIKAVFDANGNCRFECGLSARVPGSYDSAVRVYSDGFRVSLSGNVGRWGREDNLFNHGWLETLAAANRILGTLGLPAFSPGVGIPLNRQQLRAAAAVGAVESWGAVVSRIDLTCNYRAGSDAQARAVIRWLQARSVARMKRGLGGDESVWWANDRRMLKAYRKGAEMRKHGGNEDVAQWADDNGIVRVEVELKKRLLSDLGLNRLDAISDERLAEVFFDQTEIFRAVDHSDEPDIIAALPSRSRALAAAWLAGQDVQGFVSRATLFRHAKILREHGIDILQPRNLERFPVKVRVIELEPVAVPDWYQLKAAA